MSLDKDIQSQMDKPLEEIQEDYFLRKDVFKDEPWYGDLIMFVDIGICKPSRKYMLPVRKALQMLGYHTKTVEKEGKTYVLPGARERNTRSKEQQR